MWELRNVLWKVGMVLKVAHVNSGYFWIILRDDMNFKIIEKDDLISCKISDPTVIGRPQLWNKFIFTAY